jgi:energy-coupling factor transporter ATP-binding protein EcfA2
MKIEIKKNSKPVLKTTKFSVDVPLDIKLNKYELSKFLNKHSMNLLVGKPASGKTTLLYALFSNKELLYKVFENVILFQPSESQASSGITIFSDIEHKYHELSEENLLEVLGFLQEETKEGYNSCIIIDDMTASLKDKSIKKILKQIAFNRRHLRTSIYVLSQVYKSLEKDIRKCFSNMFIFKCSKSELHDIFIENIEIEPELIDDITKIVFDIPHNFLFINTDTGKLFKNWDEIIFT